MRVALGAQVGYVCRCYPLCIYMPAIDRSLSGCRGGVVSLCVTLDKAPVSGWEGGRGQTISRQAQLFFDGTSKEVTRTVEETCFTEQTTLSLPGLGWGNYRLALYLNYALPEDSAEAERALVPGWARGAVSHFLIYQSPACFTDPDLGAAAGRVGTDGSALQCCRGERDAAPRELRLAEGGAVADDPTGEVSRNGGFFLEKRRS